METVCVVRNYYSECESFTNLHVMLFSIATLFSTADCTAEALLWGSYPKGWCRSRFATHTLFASSLSCGVHTRAFHALKARSLCTHFGAVADNYFVYVISDLISTFASATEYLRYGETVLTWPRLKQKRAFILRRAQTQFIRVRFVPRRTDRSR